MLQDLPNLAAIVGILTRRGRLRLTWPATMFAG